MPDKLHELIHAMSMSEKRYFTLHAQRQGQDQDPKTSNYFQLYEILTEMAQYDNQVLIEKLQQRSLPTSHIASDKHYLYASILKNLSAFHAENSGSLQVKEWLKQAEILYTRGLYRQCLALLRKAQKRAREYNQPTLEQEVFRWRCKALGHLGKVEKLGDVLNDARDGVERLQNLYDYQQLYYEMIALRNEADRARSKESLQNLQAFMNHPLLQQVEAAHSMQARLYFWQVFAMYYYITDEREAEIRANQALQTLMESKDHYKQEFPMEYATVCCRILNLLKFDKDELFNAELARLKKFVDHTKREREKVKAMVDWQASTIQLSRLIGKRRWKQALAYVPRLEQAFEEHALFMSPAKEVTFRYLLGYTYFGNQQFKAALHHIKFILDQHAPTTRLEIYVAARVLNPVILYELKHRDVILSQLRPAQRLFKRLEQPFRLERYLVELLKKLAKIPKGQSPHSLFVQAAREVEAIVQDPFERKALRYFDALAWIQGHVQAP